MLLIMHPCLTFSCLYLSEHLNLLLSVRTLVQSFRTFTKKGPEPLHHLNTADVASGFLSNKNILTRADPIPELPSFTQMHQVNTKNCQFQECVKGARGASGFCIAYVSERRCQRDGCQKGAKGRAIYCKAHDGVRRGEHLGCTKSADGRTDFCIAQVGGSAPDCTKSARGRNEFCVRHGEVREHTASLDGCGKNAQGSADYYKAHGGGKRCSWRQAEGIGGQCHMFARGKTGLCAAHSAQCKNNVFMAGPYLELSLHKTR